MLSQHTGLWFQLLGDGFGDTLGMVVEYAIDYLLGAWPVAHKLAPGHGDTALMSAHLI